MDHITKGDEGKEHDLEEDSIKYKRW